MEEVIKQFLSVSSGSGCGDGSGYGSGSGSGYGSGSGCGSGSGSGSGYGYGYGSGSGCGSGSGSGCGSGSGSGSGSGCGIKSFNGQKIYEVDGINTIISSIRGNIAKGFILQIDLTITPCFIVKESNKFAHGETLHEAFEALQEKMYDDSTEEERISKFKEHFTDFNKKYKAKELFTWHHILTGSCKAGRMSFCRDHGIDIDKDEYTVHDFINITKNAYGGNVISKLLQ